MKQNPTKQFQRWVFNWSMSWPHFIMWLSKIPASGDLNERKQI